MTLLLLTTLAHAGCPAPVAPVALQDEERAAVAAMAALDDAAFQAAVARADADLDCIVAPLTPAAAAAWHRTHALAAFASGDAAAAALALRAAATADPDTGLPPEVAPAGGVLDTLWQLARHQPPGARGPSGAAWFDGVRGVGRPLDVPTLLQEPDGASLRTRLLTPDEAWAPAPPPSVSGAASARRKSGPSVPLLVGGGVALAGAGGLYLASAASRDRYDDLDHPVAVADLPALRDTTNAEAVAAAVLGVVGVVGVTVAFVW